MSCPPPSPSCSLAHSSVPASRRRLLSPGKPSAGRCSTAQPRALPPASLVWLQSRRGGQAERDFHPVSLKANPGATWTVAGSKALGGQDRVLPASCLCFLAPRGSSPNANPTPRPPATLSISRPRTRRQVAQLDLGGLWGDRLNGPRHVLCDLRLSPCQGSVSPAVHRQEGTERWGWINPRGQRGIGGTAALPAPGTERAGVIGRHTEQVTSPSDPECSLNNAWSLPSLPTPPQKHPFLRGAREPWCKAPPGPREGDPTDPAGPGAATWSLRLPLRPGPRPCAVRQPAAAPCEPGREGQSGCTSHRTSAPRPSPGAVAPPQTWGHSLPDLRGEEPERTGCPAPSGPLCDDSRGAAPPGLERRPDGVQGQA